MVFQQIEKLKREYTDKYVLVDESRPELRRFAGMTGTVKTVNMSGRALVEFDAYNNIGWYDIDVAYLKVVDQPLPKPEEKPAKKAEKAAPAAKAEKPAAAAPAAKAAAPAGKSMADILAAARGGAKPAAGAAPAAPKAEKPAVEKPAASAGDAKKMSVAEMIAAAKGGKPAAPKVEAAAAPAAPKSTPPPVAKATPVPAAPEPLAPPPAAAAESSTGVVSLKGKFKTAAEICAYVRGAK